MQGKKNVKSSVLRVQQGEESEARRGEIVPLSKRISKGMNELVDDPYIGTTNRDYLPFSNTLISKKNLICVLIFWLVGITVHNQHWRSGSSGILLVRFLSNTVSNEKKNDVVLSLTRHNTKKMNLSNVW